MDTHLSLVRTSTSTSSQGAGITLVLGAGGARGMAHIGVLRALEDLHIPIRAIVGCSMGAYIGTLFALGRSANALQDLSSRTSLWDILEVFLPVPWGAGITGNLGIQRHLARNFGTHTFADLRFPLAIMTTELRTGKSMVIDTGQLAPAVRKSISMPGVFPPARDADGHLWIDGAITDPVPVRVARERFPGPVLAVQSQIHPSFRRISDKTYRRPFGWFQVSRHAHEVALWELSQALLVIHPPDLLLEPVREDFGCFGYRSSHALIQSAYEVTIAQADSIRNLSKVSSSASTLR